MKLDEMKDMLISWEQKKAPQHYTDKLKVAIKLKEAPKKDIKYVFKALSLTCWNGLEYCCASGKDGKECIWRDMALDLMDLSLADFEAYKLRFRVALLTNRKEVLS
jgi:predicted metal-binding transcription factor (methanogenesis marker protein 9)